MRRSPAARRTTIVPTNFSSCQTSLCRSLLRSQPPLLVVLLLLCNQAALLTNGQQQSDNIAGSSCVAPTDPRGLGVYSSGLYVLDAGKGAVLEYDSEDGQLIRELTTEGSVGQGADGGLKVDRGFVLVASGESTVEKIAISGSEAGNIVLGFPSSASSSNDGDQLADVTVDTERDEVYVSNYGEGGVKVYNGTTGEYKRDILGDTMAMGIAFGPNDVLYVSIPEDNTVQRFLRSQNDAENFTLIDAFINGGSGSRTRQGPWGIAINPDDYLIYVCWEDSKELTEYSQSGQELNWWEPGLEGSDDDDDDVDDGAVTAKSESSSSASSAVGLSPRFVAVDSAGDVYVSAYAASGTGDVFKYDGGSKKEIGRLSTCFGAGTTTTQTQSPAETPSPSPSVSVAPKTDSPTTRARTAPPTSAMTSARTPTPSAAVSPRPTVSHPTTVEPTVSATTSATTSTPSATSSPRSTVPPIAMVESTVSPRTSPPGTSLSPTTTEPPTSAVIPANTTAPSAAVSPHPTIRSTATVQPTVSPKTPAPSTLARTATPAPATADAPPTANPSTVKALPITPAPSGSDRAAGELEASGANRWGQKPAGRSMVAGGVAMIVVMLCQFMLSG